MQLFFVIVCIVAIVTTVVFAVVYLRSPSDPQSIDPPADPITGPTGCAGCTGRTSTGFNLKANPGAKVIAVDPSVIPLGSKVYVEGYGYAVASDTGSAIKGNKIDVFVPSKSAAYQWGNKRVKIRVLK